METSGENASRQLDSGETVHLVRDPDGKWQIKQYDWSWVNDAVLWTATVYAAKLGWENMTFETKDDACVFVDRQIKAGKVPGSAGHRTPT
jgi:hypothetical protein